MLKAFTLPELQTAIISRIQTVRTEEDALPVPTYAWPGINDLILKQDVVGWRNFMEGGILYKWAAKNKNILIGYNAGIRENGGLRP
jgi:hypothetical protein